MTRTLSTIRSLGYHRRDPESLKIDLHCKRISTIADEEKGRRDQTDKRTAGTWLATTAKIGAVPAMMLKQVNASKLLWRFCDEEAAVLTLSLSTTKHEPVLRRAAR